MNLWRNAKVGVILTARALLGYAGAAVDTTTRSGMDAPIEGGRVLAICLRPAVGRKTGLDRPRVPSPAEGFQI